MNKDKDKDKDKEALCANPDVFTCPRIESHDPPATWACE